MRSKKLVLCASESCGEFASSPHSITTGVGDVYGQCWPSDAPIFPHPYSIIMSTRIIIVEKQGLGAGSFYGIFCRRLNNQQRQIPVRQGNQECLEGSGVSYYEHAVLL